MCKMNYRICRLCDNFDPDDESYNNGQDDDTFGMCLQSGEFVYDNDECSQEVADN